MLFLKVTRRAAMCASADKLTSGSVGIPVYFEFSEEWDGLSKVAVFCAGDLAVDVYLSEDHCTVPPEVLATPGEELTIGVYGTDGTGTVVLPTVYADVGPIRCGAAPSGVEPTPQTQPLIDQLIGTVQEARDSATAAENAATQASETATRIQQDYLERVDAITDQTMVPVELELVQNEYVKQSGEFGAYSGWARTGLIPVTPGQTIIIESVDSSKYNCNYPIDGTPSGWNWTRNIGTTTKQLGNNVYFIALSGPSAGMAQLKVYLGDAEISLKDELPLTAGMADEVAELIEDATQVDALVHPNAYLLKPQIPEYYFARNETPEDKHDIGYLDDKINNIPEGYHFLFVTDTHWVNNAMQSTKLLSYVRDRIGAKFVLFGGDILTAHRTEAIAYRCLCDFVHEQKNAFGSCWLPVVGNHDLNSSGPTAAHLTYADLVPLFTQGCDARFHYCDFYDERIDEMAETAQMTAEDVAKLKQYFRTCYYVDDRAGKTRFIVYNTGIGSLDGGSGIQTFISSDVQGSYEELLILEWMYHVLMSVPEGYNVVLCSHIPCSASTGSSGGTPITAVRKAFATLFPNFIAKANASVSISSSISNIERWCPRTQTFDFRQAPDIGTLMILGGHYHADTFIRYGFSSGGADQGHTSGTQSEINETEMTVLQSSGETGTGHYRREVPIIITQHDAYTRNSMAKSHPMALGTVTEQVIDVVTIRPNGDIALTRIGAGNDRYVTVS